MTCLVSAASQPALACFKPVSSTGSAREMMIMMPGPGSGSVLLDGLRKVCKRIFCYSVPTCPSTDT